MTRRSIPAPMRRALGPAALALFLSAAPTAWALDPAKDLGQYIIDVWGTHNSGIPQNSVLCMTQTRDGYLWVGTFEGLCRFDGQNFTVFDTSNTPAIPNNSMQVMVEGPDGTLWVGTPNGLLSLREGRFRTYTAAEGLPGDFIQSLCFDARGRLWVGTTQGVAFLQDGAFSRVEPPAGMDYSYVSALCTDQEGTLWTGTGAGLFVWRQGAFARHPLPDGKAGNTIWALCAARDGTLWIGTAGERLLALQGSILRSYGPAEGLSGSRVRTLLQDRHGTLWVGTDNGGLNRLENGTFTSLQSQHGLSNESVRALAEDHEGSLWVGTGGGGLNRLKDDRYVFYSTRNGLPVDIVRSVMQDRAGDLWIGTVGGGLVRRRGTRFEVFAEGAGMRSNRIWSLAQSKDGAIWAGTYGGGLHRLKDGRVTVWSTRNGLSNDIVRAILAAADGSLWVGTNGGGIDVLYPDGRIQNYSRRNGLQDDFIYALAQDPTGVVWAGTYNGDLCRFQDGRIEVLRPQGKASQNTIWTIRPDGDGALWLGTNGGGLVRYKAGAFRTVDTRRGLFNDRTFQILEDDQGYFWMNCNKGIFRVRKAELNDCADGRIPRVQSFSFGLSQGVRVVESTGPAQPAGWKGQDGRLWFPTIKGVAVVDPDYRKRNEQVPPVRIERMAVDGEAVDLAARPVLGPGRRRIEFTFTALSFLVPERNRFRTLLEGYDRGWSPESGQRQVAFTNLPPGRYVFRVQACNNDGLWNTQGARLEFELRPHVYETRTFLVLAITAVLLATFAGLRWRFRILQRRERELETLVQERTRDLSRVNEELLQANRMQGELQRIAVHDLKNPLQAIIGSAQTIQYRMPENPLGLSLADGILDASGRMLHLIQEMLEVSRFESGDIKLDLRRLDLGELAGEAADAFSGPMLQKDQTLTLDLAQGIEVLGDREWMREVLENLISNAVKFSPAGARITVRTEAAGDRVRLAVQDQGPGLTEEDQQHLFGKFQRLSARPTGGESSSGLGLSIVDHLVRSHGGRVWAESQPGEGATFWVELPRA